MTNLLLVLYFVIQRQGSVGTGEGEFVTPFDYDNTLQISDGKLVLYENLDYLTLDLDGQPIITQETGNVIFLKAIQGGIHHSKTQLLRRFYSYSFALEPEKHQPSGTCNFSRIDYAQLSLKLTNEAKNNLGQDSTITIFTTNYNVLRIMSGINRLCRTVSPNIRFLLTNIDKGCKVEHAMNQIPIACI